MLSEVYATHITPNKIQVSCNCKKGYHRFGSNKDQVTNRVEYRGLFGHGCDKYSDLKILIGPKTVRCKNLSFSENSGKNKQK